VHLKTGRALGIRAKQPWQHFLDHGAALISIKFEEAGHNIVVSDAEFSRLHVRQEEIIGLRLYTGPLFELYNGVLRAWANEAEPGIVPPFASIGKGLDVCDRFTSTLHSINSGVVKLSQLQPATVVYRGISGMKLPEPFLVPSKFNIRGGIEYGFMSATLNMQVALRYATSGSGEPSTLMVMAMGMVDRGAQLDWLSQYPDEKEILLPPLTGIEVQTDEVTIDNIRRLTMRLNINLRSTTLEQLLAARQKELGELAAMVHKDLRGRRLEGDIPRRLAAARQLEREIVTNDHDAFNDNDTFVQRTEAVLGQLPRRGDQLELLQAHSGPVFALATPPAQQQRHAGPLLVSGSRDGSTVEFGREDGSGCRWAVAHHGSPVLALTTLEPSELTAVGLFNNAIDLIGYGDSRQLIGHVGGVTALAWLTDLQWLASGSVDTDVIVWDLAPLLTTSQSGELACNWRLSGHSDTIRTLCWIESRQWLVSGSLDGTARIWKPSDGAAEAVAVLDNHDGPVTAIVTCFDLGGELWLATASADRSIIIWDLTKMCPLAKTPWCHSLGVCALAWLPEQRWLASGSADTTVNLWQLPEAGGAQMLRRVQTLRGHTDTVHALAAIPSRGWLASGSADSTIRLWRTDIGKDQVDTVDTGVTSI
jgi:hypothetical protein